MNVKRFQTFEAMLIYDSDNSYKLRNKITPRAFSPRKFIKRLGKTLVQFINPPGNIREKIAALLIIFLLVLLILVKDTLDFNVSTALLGVFSALLLLLYTRNKKLELPKIVTYPFIIFLLVIVISTLFSKIIEESFPEAILYISLFFIFILGYNLSVTSKKFTRWISNGFLLLGSIITVSYFIQEGLTKSFLEGNTFVGPFFWHNQMAAFLLYLIPLAFALLITTKGIRPKLIITPLLGFLFVALLLTYSRGAWLSFIISLIIILPIFLKGRVTRVSKTLLLIPIIAIFVISLAAFPKIRPRIASIANEFTQENRSVSGNLRVTANRAALFMLKDNPVFGIGPGVYGQAMRAYQKHPWLYAKYTHNHFLQVAAETGLVGLTSFLLIFLGVVITSVKSEGGKKRNIYKIAIGWMLVASFLHNVLDVDWNYTSLGFLFWLFLGIYVGNLNLNNKQVYTITKSSVLNVLTLVLIIFAFSSTLFLVFDRYRQIAIASYINQEFDESFQNIKRAQKIFPQSYILELYKGKLYAKEGNFDKALSSYDIASFYNPYSAQPIFEKALIHKSLNKKEEQLEHLKRAIKLNSFSSPEYYLELANYYTEKNELDRAEEILSSATTNAFPINEPYEGFSFLYKRFDFNTQHANLFLTYSQVLNKQKKFKEAQESLLKGFELMAKGLVN